MARCPTCGRSVPTIFEHVDVECEEWPDRSEDREGLDAYPGEDREAYNYRMHGLREEDLP